MRQQDFYYKNQSGSAPVIIAEPFNRAIGFAVRRVCIQVNVTLGNADVAPLDVAESFFRDCKFDWLWHDAQPFLSSLSAVQLEYLSQILVRRFAKDRIGCALLDVDVPAGGSAVKSFYFDLPIALPLMARPDDFMQSLANFGQLTFTPGGTGTALLTVTNVEIIVTAYGQKVDGMVNGARVTHRSQASVSPQNVESLSLQGKLLSLFVTGNPTDEIVATKPKVNIGDRVLLDMTNLNVIDVVKHLGPSRWTSFDKRPQLSTDAFVTGATVTEVGQLVTVEEGTSIGELPGEVGQVVVVKYNSNAAPAGSQSLVCSQVTPRTSCFTRQVPGATNRPADQLEAFIERPKLDPTGLLSPNLVPYLPEIVRTPEITAQLGC